NSRGRLMRFLDANVFIYAYYKPKRQLTQKEKQMKDYAKRIVDDVSQGKERVVTTVIHLSEIVNILKHGMSTEELAKLITGLFMLENVEIHGVPKEVYFAAVELSRDLKIDPNDALAIDVMKTNDIAEIYSFDEDFDKIEGITRLPNV
ncbi:MAG: type II toxin-antitoxin system VapC family toxin, partial [Candidatus Jordarchaeales archaeon]